MHRVFRKHTIHIAITLLAITIQSSVVAQSDSAAELNEMDAAASALGSIRSWISSDPEAAIAAFKNYEAIRAYADQKRKQYSAKNSTLARAGGRALQFESAIKTWENFLSKYHEQQPKQIATELKRQRDAVERYRKSKSSRPASFAYVPKTVWQTRNKLDVLTASGIDTAELQSEQQEVQAMVLELLATLDSEMIAKKNGIVRDAYKHSDRASVEAVVRKYWTESKPNEAIERIVMPKAAWPHTYSARIEESSGRAVPVEMDRMTVYVATRKSDSILTLNPVRLERENMIVNGKRLGIVGPQTATTIPTNEFPFDVLEKNLR